MRPQLPVGGPLVAVVGAGFHALQVPFIHSWSLPFVIRGALMMVRFCPHCDGLKPKES